MKTEDLKGKTPLSVSTDNCDHITMEFEDGTARWYHIPDCSETVEIEDINGNLQNLVGKPLLICEASYNPGMGSDDGWNESQTWTFYRFATVKGYVDIRWVGESNGYSEEVDFQWTPKSTESKQPSSTVN